MPTKPGGDIESRYPVSVDLAVVAMELAADGLTSRSQPSWRPAAEPRRARQTSFDGSVDGSVRFGLQSRGVAAALITEALPFKSSGGTRAPPPPLLHRYTRRKKLRNQALRDGAPKRLDRWPWLDETTAP